MEQVRGVSIEGEMKSSFMDYAMSVIVSRALPDVRDGLKPVHRRILYAMHQLKNYHNKPFLKAARVVGDVMGKYHPHADAAIYDALVRMAQDFSMRYPMVQGQGNFGSLDGDEPAAMRYTECRMEILGEHLLLDLEKNTVDFVPNYDNKDEEPSVLPAQFPQLLVNGCSGIAVGMATNIPPHNLREVLEGLAALIKNPEISTKELMLHIPGPDFPTYGEIHGVSGIYDAYETGRGSLVLRAKTDIESHNGRDKIIITQVPYQVNKARLVEKIADLVKEKRIEGISDLKDESSSEGIRVVVDVKRGESADVVLNLLYKLTPLQSSYGVNFVTLVRGVPKLVGLKEVLQEFYYHRREVITRRTAFLLQKSEEKAHLLLGLKIAVENADLCLEIIRGSEDSHGAQEALVSRLGMSETQAKAVLEMRLGRLTSLEREKILEDYEEVLKQVQEFQGILNDSDKITQIILDELTSISEAFGDDRRTVILPGEADEFRMESFVADEPVVVSVTHSGYVKRSPLGALASQNRGGKGRHGMMVRDDDFVENVFSTTNHQDLLVFTHLGKAYTLKVYQLPEGDLRFRGKPFSGILPLRQDERVVSVLSLRGFEEGQSVILVTRRGFIKKMDLMAFSNVRSTGIIAIKLDEVDSLVECGLCEEKDEIFVATSQGKAIRFPQEDVRSMGRTARGVTAIRFGQDSDSVVGMVIVKPEGSSCILSICEKGYGKQTNLDAYRGQSRGGKGIYTVKVTEKNGPVVALCHIHEPCDLVLVTSSGKIMKCPTDQISTMGRLTQGVRLMFLGEDEKILAVGKVPLEEP